MERTRSELVQPPLSGPSSAKKFRPAPSSASTSSSSAAQAASTSTPSSDHQSSSSKLVKQEHKEHDDHEQDTLGGEQDDTFGDDSHQGGTEDYGGYDDGAADDGLGFDGDESGAGPSDIGKVPLLNSVARLRQSRSYVWSYATRHDRTTASCNICGKVMPTTNGSTTGIKQHLCRNHQISDPNYVPKLKTELPKFPY